ILSVTFLPQAKASFIGTYDLSNFTLTNTNADGSAMTPDSGLTLVLTGPNNGSDLAGTTSLTISAAASGLLQFSYSYSSLDTPEFDFAGYILGATFIQLADTDGQSGSISVPITAGQTFGFRVGSLDNTGEPGVLTISNFNAPSNVPEPGTLPLALT